MKYSWEIQLGNRGQACPEKLCIWQIWASFRQLLWTENMITDVLVGYSLVSWMHLNLHSSVFIISQPPFGEEHINLHQFWLGGRLVQVYWPNLILHLSFSFPYHCNTARCSSTFCAAPLLYLYWTSASMCDAKCQSFMTHNTIWRPRLQFNVSLKFCSQRPILWSSQKFTATLLCLLSKGPSIRSAVS